MTSTINSSLQLQLSSSTSSNSSSSSTISINETSLPGYISQLQTNAGACYGNLGSAPNPDAESFYRNVECGKHAKLTPKTLPTVPYSIIFDYLDPTTLLTCAQLDCRWDKLVSELAWDSFDITRLCPLGLTIFDANDWKKIFNPRLPGLHLGNQGLHLEDQVPVNNRILIPMLIKLLKLKQIDNHGITLITMPRGLTIYHLYQLAYMTDVGIQHNEEDFSTLNHEVLKTTYFMAITDHVLPVTLDSNFLCVIKHLIKQDHPFPIIKPNHPFFQEISSVIQKNFDIERDSITNLLLWDKLLATKGLAIPSLLELITAQVIQFHKGTRRASWGLHYFTSSKEQYLVPIPMGSARNFLVQPHSKNKALATYMKGVHRFNPPNVE